MAIRSEFEGQSWHRKSQTGCFPGVSKPYLQRGHLIPPYNLVVEWK